MPDRRPGDYPGSLVHRANRQAISPSRPQSSGLRDSLRDIAANSFRGGQITWSPASSFNAEQTIGHKLGRVPVGLFLLGGTAPMGGFWYTKAQKARWTSEKIFLHVATHGLYEAGQDDWTSGTSFSITLGRSVPLTDYSIHVTSREAAAFDHAPLKVDGTTVDPDDSTRFVGFTVKKADELAPASPIEFAWAVWGALSADDEFVWQVM